MARKLIVEIIGDDSSLRKSLARSSKETKQFQATVTKTGQSLSRVFTAGIAGVGAAAFFKSAIGAASDLNEQLSKTQQVFGDSAQDIQSWAQTTATAFGISRREALGTASSFGALFQPMGLVGAKAAEQSRKLTELGADLASFYNTDVSDALDAVRSGIVGEAEPLRRYGVLLSESRVQAEALSETHKQSAKDLTASEKALARIALIFKDTTKAQGDYARTSEGLANQTRTLSAELDDLKTTFGELWTPAATKIVAGLNSELKTLLDTSQDLNATNQEQATLVPEIARKYGIMRERGVSAADTIQFLTRSLGGSAKASDLVATAINYFAGGPMRDKITKLAQEVKGLGVDAETAAKQMHGLAASTDEVAKAAPRGLAALQPGARISLGLAAAGLTPGTGDDLAELAKQHELNQRKAESLRNRLRQATGKRANTLAGQLEQVYIDDRETLGRIKSIQDDIRQKAQDAAQKQKDADQKQRDAAKKAAEQSRKAARAARERAINVATLAVARAQATAGFDDDLKTQRHLVAILRQQLAADRSNVDLQRQLFDAEQAVNDTLAKRADAVKQQKLDAANIAAARAGLTPYLSDDLAAARKQLAVLRAQHANALDIIAAQKTVQDLEAQIAQQARDRAKTARDAKQFAALGLTSEGLERAPGVKTLRAEAAKLTRALHGTILDTKKNRSILRGIRQVLSGELGAIGREMRLRIQQMIDDLNRKAEGVGKKRRKMVGGIYVDKYGNAIGAGLPNTVNFVDPYTSAMTKFTGAVQDATEALSSLDKLRIFADLRQFGGNLWSRAGAAAMMAGMSTVPASHLENMPRTNMWGTGRQDTSGIFGGTGRRAFGGVVVNQHFNAPTTDRHREARYALAATRAVFDT